MPAATGYIGVLKNSLVEFEGTDYANQMTRARLVPDTASQQIKTLVPDGSITDVDSPTYTFEIAGIQKDATGGLAKLLNDSAPGTLLDVVWEPLTAHAGQPHYEFQVRSQPVPIGGDQGAFAVFEVVLQVEGTPVRTDATS